MDGGQTTAALIGASAAVGVGLLTWLLGQITSFVDYRRKKGDERASEDERSRAVLHGSFAVCNFLAAKLNDWDQTRNVPDLARMSVAQSYIARLIDRSPHKDEVLSVSLIDLGLRLESLLFVVGRVIGEGQELSESAIEQVDNGTIELGAAVELLQILLDSDSAMISDEELAGIVANPEALQTPREAENERN